MFFYDCVWLTFCAWISKGLTTVLAYFLSKLFAPPTKQHHFLFIFFFSFFGIMFQFICDKDIIYLLLLLFIMRDTIYLILFYYYQIFCFIRFYFSLYMIRHYILYIEQYSNISIRKLLLNCFHQIPLVNIFSTHNLYISITVVINLEQKLWLAMCTICNKISIACIRKCWLLTVTDKMMNTPIIFFLAVKVVPFPLPNIFYRKVSWIINKKENCVINLSHSPIQNQIETNTHWNSVSCKGN